MKTDSIVYSKIAQAAYDSIPQIDWETDKITEQIAAKIFSIMKAKGISKKQLAELTHKQPSEVTKWLAGGHNFTCKTIAIISQALGEDIIQIAK